MEQHGTTYAALSRELGISKNGFKYWEKIGNLPNTKILLKIADHFGVTVAWLTGNEGAENDKLPDDENELLEVFRQLNKSGKRQLIGKAYELLDSQQTPPSGDEIAPPDINLVSTVLDRGINTKK